MPQSAPFRLGQAERQGESWRCGFFAPLATEQRPGMGYLIVFLGAGIGGALRHGTNLACARLCGTAFPWGTLTVNVVGSLVMGLLTAWFAFWAGTGLTQHARLFLTTGRSWRLHDVFGVLPRCRPAL